MPSLAFSCPPAQPSLTSFPFYSLTMRSFVLKMCVSRVLILGGGGRVGLSTIRSLHHLLNNSDGCLQSRKVEITIGGRNEDRLQKAVETLRKDLLTTHSRYTDVGWRKVDAGNEASVRQVLEEGDYQLLVNVAGPFQFAKYKPGNGGALGACLKLNVGYLDVCDSVGFARWEERVYEEVKKKDMESVCWICAGIYPGVSNLMAATGVEEIGGASEVQSVRFSYYTAGSGGVGTTILASTLGLLAEPVETYRYGGGTVMKKAADEREMIDFGGSVGIKEVYLLNLPEVVSVANNLLRCSGGGTVEARFGTDPPIWNWLLRTVAAIVPQAMLRNQTIVRGLALFSIPIVRLVDKISGAKTAIRVDVVSREGSQVRVSYEHESLEQCVGEATSAFIFERLNSNSSCAHGLFYPEELDADARRRITANAARNSNRYTVEFGA